MLDGVSAYAGVGLGVARPGTDDELGGILRDKLVEGDLVVAEDCHIGALEDKVLVDVPGEGIIVVYED